MNRLHRSSDTRIVDLGPDRRFGRPVLVLGALLTVVGLATGCSVADGLTYDTTTTSQEATTSTLSNETSTTLAETTTTEAPTTTTTEVEPTTTTEVPTTTTTEVAEAATTTEAPVAVAGATSTTVPPAVVPPAVESPGGAQQPAVDGTDAETPENDVLYEISDWSSGISGWAAAGQWKTAAGMLVTDGTSDSFAVAPVDLTGYPDYAVECEVQIIDPEDETVVALLARMINGVAYYGGFDGAQSRMVVGYEASQLGSAPFVLDSQWHTYRLEVRGNTIKLFLERAEVARAMDNRALEPGTVGIYCGSGQINVRSFRVLAL